MKLFEELKWRGLIKDVAGSDLEDKLNNEQVTFYWGTDPTADSLHLGHYSSLLTAKRLSNAGHHPILLVGGATGLIGDPRPTSEREIMDKEVLRQNLEGIKKQVDKIFDGKAEIVNNYDWMKDFNYLDFLRDVGKYININYMLSKDIINRRLETGITYAEFSYTLMQGYDFLHLYETKNCIMQAEGSDQWGNITTGIDLIRKKTGKEAYAFTNQMKSIIGDITLGDIVDVNKEDLGITGDIGNQSIMDFNTFAQHKQQVIRNSINTNLRATIAKFNENSTYPAKMPTLTENEWSMILSNTCLISFMQGQNIGNGYYMGYSIVTNNKNREFVDPKLIYILDQDKNQYHDVRHFSASLSGNIIGYRNTDFEAQSFVSNDSTTKNYYPHGSATADYACIVTSSEITSSNGSTSADNASGNRLTDLDTILDSAPANIRKAYYTALFRERYNSYKSLALSGI